MNKIKKTGIILGSGLGKISDELSHSRRLFKDLQGFHKAEAMEGELFGHSVILFSGRRHFYEGYSQGEVLKFAQMAYESGVDLLVVTNAAGGVNSSFKVSDLMIMSSWINLMKFSLPGGHHSSILNNCQRNLFSELSKGLKLNLRYGVYCCTSGPNYETNAEIRLLKKFGIDAVGMSTVPEILFAIGKKLKVIGISCITNLLKENTDMITDHADVIRASDNAYERFARLISGILENKEKLLKC